MPAFIRTSPRKAARNRAKAANYRKVCALVETRDRKCCRVCGVFMFLPAHHHLVFRSQGGKDTTENLICICGTCHDEIHDRRIRVSGNANETLTIESAA